MRGKTIQCWNNIMWYLKWLVSEKFMCFESYGWFFTRQSRILCYCRKKKLEESCQYQQFCVGVDEEEAWLNEKTALLSSEEVGDTLATVQVYREKQRCSLPNSLIPTLEKSSDVYILMIASSQHHFQLCNALILYCSGLRTRLMSTSIDRRVYACLDRMYCTWTCP